MPRANLAACEKVHAEELQTADDCDVAHHLVAM